MGDTLKLTGDTMPVVNSRYGIFEAINKTMQDVGAVGKNSKNASQGFAFRGIDAVMNALHPAMVKNGIFVTPEVLELTRDERETKSGAIMAYTLAKVKYTFWASDGSSIEAVVYGEGADSGDKSTSKALSIAFKYACFQVFCIPTEDMVDPDAESPQLVKKTTKKKEEAPKEEPPKDDKPIGEELAIVLEGMLKAANVNISGFCAQYGIKTLAEFKSSKYPNMCNKLQEIIDGKK